MVAAKTKPQTKRVTYVGNPIITGQFISENTYVGCGYDNVPMAFKRGADGEWTHFGSLDPGFGTTRASKIASFGNNTALFKDSNSMDAGTLCMPRETQH